MDGERVEGWMDDEWIDRWMDEGRKGGREGGGMDRWMKGGWMDG